MTRREGNLDSCLASGGRWLAGRHAEHYNYFRDYDPVTGRYVESDPIGINGGINSYGYVHQSPLLSYDPHGLKVIWKGTVSSFAGIEGVGAGFFMFDLVSDCVGGKIVKAKVLASSGALGAGAKFTGGGSAVRFFDWTEQANADTLNGAFAAITGGVVAGGGAGCSKYTVGHAYSDGSLCGGPAYGFDFSVGAYFGAAMVISSETTDCSDCAGASR